ncbi:MAG: Gfo/Idh/MocA family oxidoreductase [Opitutales bacterium]|nr:Gfo/Idh/MocA family oxidoreductase [Opitutales bacterium]
MLRKDFIRLTAAAFAGTCLAPSLLAGGNGNDTVNLAVFGLGGMGLADMEAFATLPGVRIVALCDCDERAIKRARARLATHRVPADTVEGFVDYREVFTKCRSRIDAAVVATPDHSHFDVAMEAVRHRKHLFVEKPICKTIPQLRELTAAAAAAGLITQAGNQGAVSNLIRVAKEWIEAGVLGEITRVSAWTNRPIWPQGMQEEPAEDPCPPQLHWDLWLGNAAKRPYSKAIAPFNWRGWIDYGTGALGDMAQHVLNPAFFMLDLERPQDLIAETRGKSKIAFPQGSKIIFKFKTKSGKPLDITWFDGNYIGNEFVVPAEGRELIGGSIFHGTKNDLLVGSSGETIRLLRPYDKAQIKKIRSRLPRIKGNIYRNWTECLQGKSAFPPVANFNAMQALTETVLMGVNAQIGKNP